MPYQQKDHKINLTTLIVSIEDKILPKKSEEVRQ